MAYLGACDILAVTSAEICRGIPSTDWHNGTERNIRCWTCSRCRLIFHLKDGTVEHSGQHDPQQSTLTQGVSLRCQAQCSYTDTGSSLEGLGPFFSF